MVWQFYVFLSYSTIKSPVIKNSALEYVSLNIFISSFKSLIKFTLNHFEFIGGHYKKPRHFYYFKLSYLFFQLILFPPSLLLFRQHIDPIIFFTYTTKYPGFLLYFVVLHLLLIKLLYPLISNFSNPVQLFAIRIISFFPTNLKKICIS